jgi:hypothetical protein
LKKKRAYRGYQDNGLKLVQIVDDDLSDFTHTMGSMNAFANPNEGGNNNNGQVTLTNKLQIT